MSKTIYWLLISVLLVGCETKPYPDYVWDPEIEKLKGDKLQEWIDKAPFKGKWDPYEDVESGALVFTNENEVFPFMAAYKKEDGMLNAVEDIYQQQKSIFKDGKRESFAHATLLTHDEPLFLTKYNTERGNILTGSLSNMDVTHTATLEETYLNKNDQAYKTALYWVDNPNGKYLMAFYQKRNLVLQVAFPCEKSNTQYAIKKVQELNTAMGLGISEWEKITPQQLKVNNTPLGFWKDPYVSLYATNYFTSLGGLKVKLGHTGFTEVPKQNDEDYRYSYHGSKGAVVLSFTRKETPLSQMEFDQQLERTDEKSFILDSSGYGKIGKIFITSKEQGGQHLNKGKTYFKNNTYLEIDYAYPVEDGQAKVLIEDILLKLRVSHSS